MPFAKIELLRGGTRRVEGIDLYENYPSVWLDIHDEELREQVVDILRRWRVTMGAERDPGNTVGISDQPDFDERDVLYLWDGERRPRPGSELPSPFEAGFRRHWVGVQPDIDEWSLVSSLAQMKSRHFLRMPELLGDGAYIKTRYANASDERAKVIDEIEQEFVRAGVRDHIRQSLAQSMDELFTNAIYNAPVGDDGMPLFASTSRKEVVQSPKPVMIQYGYTPHFASIAIRDNYGTLPIQRVMDRWRQCWNHGGAKFEEKDGGAGLGFYMLLERVSRISINVREGVFSEIVLLVRRGWSRKKTLKSIPSINLCVMEASRSSHDLRQHDRYPIAWDAMIEDQDVRFPARILDLSNSGAFITIAGSHGLTARDTLVMHINHPGSNETIKMGATVRWVGRSAEHSESGLGVQFHTLLDAVILLKNAGEDQEPVPDKSHLRMTGS